MNSGNRKYRILIVDDEWQGDIVREVVSRIETEGWEAIIVRGAPGMGAEGYERSTLDYIGLNYPDGLILDLHFGGQRDDRFGGIQILRIIVEEYPDLPVLVFTRYDRGPDRWYAEENALKYVNAKVDYIDKSASADAVVLRLRRLIGTQANVISIGDRIYLDANLGQVGVYPRIGEDPVIVKEIAGAMFEIFRELVEEWYRNPGHVVRHRKFEHHVASEQVLRTRISEIRKYIGTALGVEITPDRFIVSVRGIGYYLEPIRD